MHFCLNIFAYFSKVQQVYQRISMLYPILYKNSTIQKKCSLLIFKQIIRPILTYACPVWGNCASSHTKKMQIVQNKVLIIIANAPWFVSNATLHKNFQIQEIEEHIKSKAKNFHSFTGTLSSDGDNRSSFTKIVHIM